MSGFKLWPQYNLSGDVEIVVQVDKEDHTVRQTAQLETIGKLYRSDFSPHIPIEEEEHIIDDSPELRVTCLPEKDRPKQWNPCAICQQKESDFAGDDPIVIFVLDREAKFSVHPICLPELNERLEEHITSNKMLYMSETI